MSDWEAEADDIEAKEKEENEKEKETEKKTEKDKISKQKEKFADEVDKITVPKQEVQGTIRHKDKPIDYEKKYQEKKGEDIKYAKEIEESVKNIKDPELRLKKKLELQQLRQAEKFLEAGGDKKKKAGEEKEIELKSEKDFIELAQKNAAKINEANPLPMFTLAYLKNSIELLAPSLKTELVRQLVDSLSIIYNQKLDKDRGKKKVSDKPQIVAGKKSVTDARKGLYNAYGGGEENEEDDDEDAYNEDDFM